MKAEFQDAILNAAILLPSKSFRLNIKLFKETSIRNKNDENITICCIELSYQDNVTFELSLSCVLW